MADSIADPALARENMVAHQVARRGIRDRRVLAAMAKVPRERFVEPGYQEFAYEDSALPIAEEQTISQPYIVAAMAEAGAIKPDDKVLEVGTGSGYAAAIFAELAREVFTIERHASLANAAKERLAALGYQTINVRIGDGTLGWPEAAPFDAIIVAAGGPRVPAALKGQLAVGGRLVIPVGQGRVQSLQKITRHSETRYSEEDLGSVQFVRLIGDEGWRAPDDEHSQAGSPRRRPFDR